jgi:phage terminase small subunit
MNTRQQLFCDHYIKSLNATEAAVKAGYSKKTARQLGNKLLTNVDVKSYIDKRLDAKKNKAILAADEVLELLTKIAMGQITEKIPIGLGGGLQKLTENEPTFKDRLKAAELLGKYNSLFVDKKQVELEASVSVNIIDDIVE